MIRASTIAAVILVLVAANPCLAYEAGNQTQTQPDATGERLMIVNGNTGHVIYDDGRDDLFCLARRHVAGRTDDGRRIYRRTMRCR